jgi:hypothetical protein
LSNYKLPLDPPQNLAQAEKVGTAKPL